MKKKTKIILAVVLSAVLIFGVTALIIHRQSSTFQVYVTILVDDGEPAIAYVPVNVRDFDKDGIYTIDDVLYCAHEKYYEGGSPNGYASYNSHDYEGLSLLKLWGVSNNACFGYYVNDERATSLSNKVAKGDHIYAFTYRDLENFSDIYTFFDKKEISINAGETFTLNMKKACFDEDYDRTNLAYENAVIVINGEKTKYVTDKDGNVTLTLNKKGSYVIVAAAAGSDHIIPPVCKVEVKK